MSSFCRIVVLAMLVAGVSAPAGLAQKETPVSSEQDIKDAYGKALTMIVKDVKTISNELKNDIQNAAGIAEDKLTDEQKRTLETIAAYYVCRVTWNEYVDNAKNMETALKEFNTLLTVDVQRIMRNQYFHKQLTLNFRKVLIDRKPFLNNPLSSINAAQMLPMLGKGKNAEFSDLLTELINDPKQHDAVKLYAIKALADFLPLPTVTDERDFKRVDALMRYIERKDWPVPIEKAKTKGKDKDKDKENEAIAVVSFLRREAIQVLARAQFPSVRVNKGDPRQGQLAVTLLKVLAKDALAPLPPPPAGEPLAIMGLAERCEAAFGLCSLKADPANYRSDLCVYAAGCCLYEFIDAYQADETNKIKGAFDKNGLKRTQQLHWKHLAERWKESLASAVRNSEDKSLANTQAKALQQHTDKMLKIISTQGLFNAKDASAYFKEKGDFERYLKDLKRPVTPLFRTNPAQEVAIQAFDNLK
jgi:hypothetical protein